MKNTVFQYGLQAARYLFPLVTLPYLTRMLGTEGFAVRAYVLAVMSFAQVFLDFGFTPFGTKAVAENEGDSFGINKAVTTVVALRLALAVFCFVFFLAVGPAIPIVSSHFDYLLIAFFGACCKAMLPDFVFQGQEDMGFITKRFLLTQALSAVLIFALIDGPEDLLMVPIIEGLCSTVALCWSWGDVVLRRSVRLVRVSANYLKSAFRISGVFFLSNASTTIYTSLTTILIGIFINNQEEIAYWALSMTAVSVVQSLYTPITNSLYPHMVKRRDWKLARRLLLAGTCVALMASILFASLSDFIIFLMGGSDYSEGSYVVAMVAPVLLFSFPAMLVGFPVLAAIGEERRLSISSVIAACFHIMGLMLLLLAGAFTIPFIAVLRCCTELVLMSLRLAFALPALKGACNQDSEGGDGFG